MSTPRVRLADRSDFGAIARLGDAVNALHHAHYPAVFSAPGDLAAHEALWSARAAAGEQFWVACDDLDVVGFASAKLVDEKPTALLKPARFVRFGSIAVATAHRGRGIGTALMQAVTDWARAAGASEVCLNVFEFNSGAVRLYERLGYQSRSRNMALRLAP
jgi:GNAT superfamily N-acetyltransferase